MSIERAAIQRPSNDTPPGARLRRLGGSLFLVAAILATRASLLAVSQRFVCGDEAAVGIMAKHVLEGSEHPAFAWHEHYNGGAAVTAHLAVVPFLLLGVSESSLKTVPFFWSLAALICVYAFVRSSQGAPKALIAALLYGTNVALMKWSFDARGGYAEGQALIPLALWLLHDRCLPTASWIDDLLLGVLCGFGIYLLPLFIPVAVTVFVFLLVRARLRGAWLGIPIWMLGIAAGGAPLVFFNAEGGPVSLELGPVLHHLSAFPASLFRTLTHDLPASMAYDNLEDFPALQLVPNGIEYGVVLVGIGLLVNRRHEAWSRSWLEQRSPGDARSTRPVLEAVLLAYVALYLLLYALHPRSGEAARHLLFLEPPLSILAGLGIADAMWNGGSRRFLARAAACLLAISVLNRAVQYVRLFGDYTIYGPLGRSDPGDADAMIAFLRPRGIHRVMSEDWDLSWRIVFKTHEQITATHSTLWLGRLLREGDLRADRYAVIVEPGSAQEQRIRHLLVKHGLGERMTVAGKTVFLFGHQHLAAAHPDPARNEGHP